MPDAAARASRGRGGSSTSTPASSASRRGSAARERAQPGSTYSHKSSTKPRRAPSPPISIDATTESEHEEPVQETRAPTSHARDREREDGRQRAPAWEPLVADAPSPEPRRWQSARVKTELPSSRRRETQTPRTSSSFRRRQVNTAPVPVPSDSDSEVPPARSPPRRNPSAPSTTESQRAWAEAHDEETVYVSFQPAWDESVSSPPKPARRAPSTPGLTRESSRDTDYHTASSFEDGDENVANESAEQQGPAPSRRRSANSVSTSSSPPTGESQYEDPEGAYSFHEWRRAEIEAKRKARREVVGDVQPVPPEVQEVPTDDDSVDEYIETPRPSKPRTMPSTPPRPKAPSAPQRSRTEPIIEATRPNTPVPLVKSYSMPPSVSVASKKNMRYKVCRDCFRPVPDPPLFRPEGPSTSASPSACSRCFQPLCEQSKSSRPSAVLKSPSLSERSFKSSPKPTSVSESESEDKDGNEDVHAMDDEVSLLSTLGLGSVLQRFEVVNPMDDPRSPMRGGVALPIS